MGSAVSLAGRTGSSSGQTCPPLRSRSFQNDNGGFTSTSLGRWLIFEDPSTHQLQFAWGDRDWCLALTPAGEIKIQQGNKLKGTACWTGEACSSSTWCTSYQDPKAKNWYKSCEFPSTSQIQDREQKVGIFEGRVAYTDRIVFRDPISGDTIEVYEDYSSYNLTKKIDDAKYSRPQLVFALNKKPVAAIDPTSLNDRATNRVNSEGIKGPSLPGKDVYVGLSNTSNPKYLGVISFGEHQARAHNASFPLSSIPKTYATQKDNDIVQEVTACELGLMISTRWSMRAALHPTRPGTLWFAYNANASSDAKSYTAAVGVDCKQGDVVEKFDGDVVVATDRFGKYVACPPGYGVVRFCGSGKDADCGGATGLDRSTMSETQANSRPVGQILCRSLTRIASGGQAVGVPRIGAPTADGVPKQTSTWTVHNEWVRKCPSGQLLTGVCVSGENPDCPKVSADGTVQNDRNSGTPLAPQAPRYRGAIQCSSFGSGASAVKVSSDQSRSVKGAHTTPPAPQGTAAVGVCNGGRNASDCPGNAFGMLYYSNVTMPKPVSPAEYLLASASAAEQSRVRAALGAPSTTVFADQRGWCNDPREKCNPAMGTTLEYQPWEKRINVYETSDATKIKPVTDPNRTIWRYAPGAALIKIST